MAKVVIYTKKNCPKCDHLKEVLNDANKSIPIEIKDTAEPDNLKWMMDRKINNVPVVVIYNDDNEEMVLTYGYTRGNIANKYNSHTGGQIFGL